MSRGPNPVEARRRYDRMAQRYDLQLPGLRSVDARIRSRAIELLCLQPGDTVLDLGYGTGASFSLLVAAVGPRGRVVGIDQSAGMLQVARRRIKDAGWSNVKLVEAPVQQASIPGPVDAALFFSPTT